ncbi:hypothetical protein ACS0TY_017008 [Phlomoides rotata]
MAKFDRQRNSQPHKHNPTHNTFLLSVSPLITFNSLHNINYPYFKQGSSTFRREFVLNIRTKVLSSWGTFS